MRASIARTMGTAAASLGLIVGLGAGIGSAASGTEGGGPGHVSTEAPVQETHERGGCDLGVMVDTYDHEPTVYGGSWLNCYDWTAYIGWLQIDLYRDGVHQGQGFCQMHEQMNCDAGMSAEDPAGDQVWKACANYEAFPHAAPGWIYRGSDCATAVH